MRDFLYSEISQIDRIPNIPDYPEIDLDAIQVFITEDNVAS
tara:strand:+ start:2507 stop:2629 length:123 start_codon:yes stop_codon:yes gene_type:complete